MRQTLYIAATVVAGWGLLAFELSHWTSQSLSRYICYVAAGLLTAGLRISLPNTGGAFSITFLLVLFGIAELSLPETIALACGITALQGGIKAYFRAQVIVTFFNIGRTSIATWASFFTYIAVRDGFRSRLMALIVATTVCFTVTSGMSAVFMAFREQKPVLQLWRESQQHSYLYYFLGSAVAGVMSVANYYVGWQTALLVVPVVYLIYCSYTLYIGRLADEKKQADEVAALQMRTIEALALAIEAKEHTDSDRVGRVPTYAVEIGREMGLRGDDLEALRAAAYLHDIGKLAVPDHITSKPGQLSHEEFEKMKIHTVVGAEILERVQFPYPVVPIVLSHHERWDGGGYPSGLAGEQIPIGARILAAVDCLDALASERQHRAALSIDEAMRIVKSESGKGFDPRVVSVLERLYVELERKTLDNCDKVPLSTELKISRGAPAAGFERAESGPKGEKGEDDFLQRITEARQEVQGLFELAQDLGSSLSLDETLPVLALRLKRMIPCDTVAIYVRRDNVLTPEYVTGDDFRLFSSLEIPIGSGLSGWVVENRKPIINGNPSVEPAYLNDPGKTSKLRSALAAPLEGLSGVVGVISLYQQAKDAFTTDHLRILLAVSSKVALAVENAIRYRQAESSATLDYLTALPNARSLFMHLDSELAKARTSGSSVAILVGDLDGFKQVNDRFGHLEGNRVLRQVAMGLKDACREHDYVARMGGDEFVLVLPGLTETALKERCTAFREAAVRAGLEVCEAEILGISIGAAFYPQDGDDPEKLLAEADRRMYAEKNENRGLRSDLASLSTAAIGAETLP